MRPNALMAVLLATAGLMPTAVSAGTSKPQPVRCPTHYVCSMSLGVGIRPPATWLALPKGKEGPYTIAFARRPVAGTSYDKRLIVKLVVVGNSLNDRGLAREEVKRLVDGLHARGVTMAAVRYGGSPGFLLQGLLATPSPALQIVVAHRSYVYLLIALGTALAADQRQVLASLVFFQPREAPPPGNSIPYAFLSLRRAVRPTAIVMMRAAATPMSQRRARLGENGAARRHVSCHAIR